MIVRAFLIILISCNIAAGEIDDNILWRYSFLSHEMAYSNSPRAICANGYGVLFLHTNPYRLRGLNWDYVSGNVGFGKWGVSGAFRSYYLSDLYDDVRISLGGSSNVYKNIYISLGTEFDHTKFGNSSEYDGLDMNFHIQYLFKSISMFTGIDRICLKKPFRYSASTPQPFVGCNFSLTENSALNIGYTQTEKTRGRWHLSHELTIADNFSLNLGYLSYPDLLQCGLDLRWKKIRFNIIYQGIDKLDDTIIWGLSTGK